MMSTYIIAEAGVNHNGDINLAHQLVEEAKKCGCNCVKFQTFRTEQLVTKTAEKAEYQVKNTKNQDSQYDMLKKLELRMSDYKDLKQHCQEIGIDFLSTPFDETSVDMLEELGMDKYKLSSGDITNMPLLKYIANKGKQIILSTGMCVMEEVEEAVGWIEEEGNHNIILLHCTSNYPTPYRDVNMNAMLTLRNTFPYPVGYSDHTQGIIIPIMAVAMGAVVIEKHFTLDKNMEGPDHKASLDVDELKEMVEAIRNIEDARGNGEKVPTSNEFDTRKAARKSLVAKCNMTRDHIITQDDIAIKRPGTGIAPKYVNDLVGHKLNRDVMMDEVLDWGAVRK